MSGRILGSLFCALAVSACFAPPPAGSMTVAGASGPRRPGSVQAAGHQEPRMLQPFPEMNGQLGVAWIPWATIDPHERALTPGAPPADLDAGEGFALRAGRYDDSLGMEIVFATTNHDEQRTGAELTTYAAYVDLTDRWELWRGPVFAWAGVGFGIGLVRFDWDSTYKSEMSGLWQGEGILALQIGDNVSLEARAMAFLAAHPTRTLGTGAMTMLGGSIAF